MFALLLNLLRYFTGETYFLITLIDFPHLGKPVEQSHNFQFENVKTRCEAIPLNTTVKRE